MKELTHLSLFSGIGGLDLASEWAGFRTVGQCEFADYPTKVLEKHWPDVPRWRDIRSVTADSFFERTGLHTVDIISGGFPCQPFSVAGKQKGKGDDRYLWPEMLRVIRELAPRWVIGENVPGILRIAGRTVCEDLEREEYAVTVFNFEAAAVGAPHRRDRVFFVANAVSGGRGEKGQRGSLDAISGTRAHDTMQTAESGGDVAYAESVLREESVCTYRTRVTGLANSGDVSDPTSKQTRGVFIRCVSPNTSSDSDGPRQVNWWSTEPNVGRVAHGIPHRVDRLKCLGNAVVPQQAYPIFQAIAEMEAT